MKNNEIELNVFTTHEKHKKEMLDFSTSDVGGESIKIKVTQETFEELLQSTKEKIHNILFSEIN